MTELEVALRREHARAVRYRESYALLLIDRAPTAEAIERIRDAVRVCDAVMPGDGGGVAVLLPETPISGALQVAERLAGMLADPPPEGGVTPVGIATHPSPRGADAAGILREAVRALEHARSQGGGVSTPPVR